MLWRADTERKNKFLSFFFFFFLIAQSVEYACRSVCARKASFGHASALFKKPQLKYSSHSFIFITLSITRGAKNSLIVDQKKNAKGESAAHATHVQQPTQNKQNTVLLQIRTRRKAPPEGFDVLESTLADIERQMRDAEAEGVNNGKRQAELLWPIYRLHHQRTRFVYDMFYKQKAISREVYEYCLREKIADADLIAKWKKAGYERLCCMRCANLANHSFGTTCVCRVPKKDLDAGTTECVNCGCRGCASGD